MSDSRDRELGMNADITRRDFLNGMALTVGGSMMPRPLWALAADQIAPDYYPPALTGLRGSHVGSFETAHAVRDGTFWEKAGKPVVTGEEYDLVVVGGGISGLAAAYYFQKAVGPQAKILILDNHDDFGGHAKRNEFRVGNRTILGYGGTFSIESPAPYSPEAKALIADLGIDVASYPKYFDAKLYSSLGLSRHIFFDKETFGVDRSVPDPHPVMGGEEQEDAVISNATKAFLSGAPLSEKARQDYQRLLSSKTDYYPGLSSSEKKSRLARISYAAYLIDRVKVDHEVVKVFQSAPHALFGVGIDAVAAQDAWGLGLPGFAGLKLDPAPGKGMNRDAIPNEEAEKYFFHFPDGNSSIARMLVRKLIPAAIGGTTAQDIVTERANYVRLDDGASPVRIRLNSTVVKVTHVGSPSMAKQVEVTYGTHGKAYTVRGKQCVLACWHNVIPYICDELPAQQKEALESAAKVPLLYTNVVLNNWESWRKLGASSFYAPGSYYTGVSLDLPVSIGDYQCTHDPREPIVVHMMKTPCHPGLPARDQHKMGRYELFTANWETLERNTRDQLARMLSPGGFDAARDIAAITVNRWPHGYAYEYNSLWDDFWLNGDVTPCEIARKPFGRIAIANADAGAYAYTDCAIDQAYRAVKELVAPEKSRAAGA
ncbi:MAG: NAD(P)-binding protein [Terriglobales bacterium]